MPNKTKKEIKKEAIQDAIFSEGADILNSERFKKAESVQHHKKYHVRGHSLRTAGSALRICDWLNHHGVKVDRRDVIRAGLLHDIGMTEDQVHDSASYRKAYSHPKEGARIAAEEYGANEIQQNAIQRHMWPVCVIPPKHVAGWVVILADKTSSHKEFFAMVKEKVRQGDHLKTTGNSVRE